MGDYILVIDEGTTSTRAIVFDRELNQVARALFFCPALRYKSL